MKKKIKKAILKKAEGQGTKPIDLLDWFNENFLPKVGESQIKECLASLITGRKIELTSDRFIRLKNKEV
ncbi:MAG: hypothetical protein HYX21_03335 [Candidatus Yanofskybacteria bacterium]|nr:hypothetical protein [Candidatus Yanofskybacteria bacterium]